MKTNALLGVTGVVELVTGAALLVIPSQVTALLLGTRLESPAADVVARIAGAALFSIGLTCWLVRNRTEGGSLTGRIAGLWAYNAGVAVLLAFGALAQGLHGALLWPAVALHAALAIWCGASLGHAERDSLA